LVDAINLTQEQQALLTEFPDAMFRQSVRDFMVNQQFRKDYWVKGARKLGPLAQAEALSAHKVVLIAPRDDVSMRVAGTLGEATLQESIYNPVLDALADHKPKTLNELDQRLRGQGLNFAQLTQAVLVLAGMGKLAAVQDEAGIDKSRKHTDLLNTHLINKARGSADISYLASPVTGGGVSVHRFQQLFLLALAHGMHQPAEWAQLAWEILAAQGQKLLKEGKTLETAEENLAALNTHAQEFAVKHLPILKALQIV
jgi:hypothetical protein